MGIFQDIIAGGLAMIREAAGVEIRIRRGGAVSLPFLAAVKQTDFTADGQDGITARARFRTYLIGTNDYAFENVPTEPLAGDRILQTINGAEREFEPVPVGDEGIFTYTDNHQTQYEVKAVQVQ